MNYTMKWAAVIFEDVGYVSLQHFNEFGYPCLFKPLIKKVDNYF